MYVCMCTYKYKVQERTCKQKLRLCTLMILSQQQQKNPTHINLSHTTCEIQRSKPLL